MKTTTKNYNPKNIYPGNYVPMFEKEEIYNALKKNANKVNCCPLLNIEELPDSFKFEVAMPGISREDILLSIDDEVISIFVFHQDTTKNNQVTQQQEFEYKCFERNIPLPKNADAEFSSAIYKDGLLIIYISKAAHTEKNVHTTIAVY